MPVDTPKGFSATRIQERTPTGREVQDPEPQPQRLIPSEPMRAVLTHEDRMDLKTLTYRLMYGYGVGPLPPVEGDLRPPIAWYDPETLKRVDLTNLERNRVKSNTFAQRYGFTTKEATNPDATDLGRAKELLEAYHREFPARDASLELDYAEFEQRIQDSVGKVEGVKHTVLNALVQAEAAESQFKTVVSKIVAYAKANGVLVEGDGETLGGISVRYPEDMPLEVRQKHGRSMARLMGAGIKPAGSPVMQVGEMDPHTQNATTMFGVDPGFPNPAIPVEASVLDGDAIRLEVPRSRVTQLGGRRGGLSRSTAMMSALASTMARSTDSARDLGFALTQNVPAPEAPNRFAGEIGRVSPDQAYKLRKAGHDVQPGAMLIWRHSATNWSEKQIFAVLKGHDDVGPIPLTLLSTKVQRRARIAHGDHRG